VEGNCSTGARSSSFANPQGRPWSRCEDLSVTFGTIRALRWRNHGSACGPVIVPVFKTGERRAIPSLVGSTPTRFRHFSRACRHADPSQISLHDRCNRFRSEFVTNLFRWKPLPQLAP
jgi:hypothetical protein